MKQKCRVTLYILNFDKEQAVLIVESIGQKDNAVPIRSCLFVFSSSLCYPIHGLKCCHEGYLKVDELDKKISVFQIIRNYITRKSKAKHSSPFVRKR